MKRLVSIIACVLAAMLLCSCGGVRQYTLEVVAEYPHDVHSYTQGLFFHDGQMYETTGQYGESTLRKVDVETGEPLQKLDFSSKYFVEGSTMLDGNLYVLTWRENVAFVYDAETLEYKQAYSYPREGWGITTDGKQLIATDGSAYLFFMDKDLNVHRRQVVRNDTRSVRWLNEIEYVDGKIWANVYTSDEIVIINPSDGKVEGVIDCTGLLPDELYTPDTDVLNGIAYDDTTGKIYLTGKNWPKLYEVRLVRNK